MCTRLLANAEVIIYFIFYIGAEAEFVRPKRGGGGRGVASRTWHIPDKRTKLVITIRDLHGPEARAQGNSLADFLRAEIGIIFIFWKLWPSLNCSPVSLYAVLGPVIRFYSNPTGLAIRIESGIYFFVRVGLTYFVTVSRVQVGLTFIVFAWVLTLSRWFLLTRFFQNECPKCSRMSPWTEKKNEKQPELYSTIPRYFTRFEY